jgi:hypothetical protein
MDRLDLAVGQLLIGWPLYLLPTIGMSCLGFVCGKAGFRDQSGSGRFLLVGSLALFAIGAPPVGYTVNAPLILISLLGGVVLARRIKPKWTLRLCVLALLIALVGWAGYMTSYIIWQWPRFQVLTPIILGLRDLAFTAAILGLSRAFPVWGVRRPYAPSLLALLAFALCSLLLHYLSEGWRYGEYWHTLLTGMIPLIFTVPIFLGLAWATRLISRISAVKHSQLFVVFAVLAFAMLAADELRWLRFVPPPAGYFMPTVAFGVFVIWCGLLTIGKEAFSGALLVPAYAFLFLPVDDVVWTIGASVLGYISIRSKDELKVSFAFIATTTLLLYSCFRAVVYFGVEQDSIDSGWRFFIEIALGFTFGRLLRKVQPNSQESATLPAPTDVSASMEPAG